VPRKAKGIKKLVFGSMLCLSGGTIILFDLMTASEPELFYILLVASGFLLFTYGTLQNRKA